MQPSPIDVLNTETLQWCKTAKAPPANDYSRMVSCDGLLYLYLSKKASVYSCSLQDLVTPHPMGEGGIWEMFGLGFPTCLYTSNINKDRATGDIYYYDRAANKWLYSYRMPMTRYDVLSVALSNNEIMVVGVRRYSISEIGYSTKKGPST